MPRAGMLLQVDGSRHDGSRGAAPMLTLVGAIDYATRVFTGATFRAPRRWAAVAAYCACARAVGKRHPVLARHLEEDLHGLLAVCLLPPAVCPSLRSTNLIERSSRELRRRLRPIGALLDRRSADRILCDQVPRLNDLLAGRPVAAFPQES